MSSPPSTSRYADWGVVYFAQGAAFVREAELSAGSVKARMPNLPLCLFSDEPPIAGLFDIERPLEKGMEMKQQKMNALRNSPFAKTLYLDTDTHLCLPIYECLDLVDGGFEFAAALTPWWSPDATNDDPYAVTNGPKLPEHGVPVAFAKVNTGVMLMARTKNTISLLDRWQTLHAAGGGRGQDQDSFRVALYENSIRWVALPPHYNYRLPYPGVVNGRIRVLHGRHSNMEKLARRLNARSDLRGTVPVGTADQIIFYGSKIVSASSVSFWLRRCARLLH